LIAAAPAAVAGTLGTDAEAGSALTHIISVGTSAGGARAKAVFTINEKTNEIRPGQALPGKDEES
jgi:serine/threonine-protein kinase HipA